MTISSNLGGLIINAASLALARKVIFVSIDIYFMFDRKLLSKLSQCVWPPARRPTARRESVERVFVLITDGCFYGEGAFRVNPAPNPKDLEDLFRYEVFKMLKAEGKINDTVIENMMQWPPARRA